jgi:AcrR family transcriptional regulator
MELNSFEPATLVSKPQAPSPKPQAPSGRRQAAGGRRQAKAAATRTEILEVFAKQLVEKGRDTLSPSEAAAITGVSVRTVHTYFPAHESQIAGPAEFFDARLYPAGVVLAAGPDDLRRYYHDIHTMPLKDRLSWVLATNQKLSGEVRLQRRA